MSEALPVEEEFDPKIEETEEGKIAKGEEEDLDEDALDEDE